MRRPVEHEPYFHAPRPPATGKEGASPSELQNHVLGRDDYAARADSRPVRCDIQNDAVDNGILEDDLRAFDDVASRLAAPVVHVIDRSVRRQHARPVHATDARRGTPGGIIAAVRG